MIRNKDPEARLDDLDALMDARTAADLHRALVLGPPAAFEREPSVPLMYFRNAHDHDPARAAETAMLLVTDPRWRVTAGPLIDAIDATGIVPTDELDVLARTFISAGPTVYWKCPDDWFSTIGIIIADREDPGSLDKDSCELDEPGPTVAARIVAPVLRRWAAARVVRLNPSSWPDVYARSTELGSEDGGALMRGILDVIDVLPLKARPLVRNEALKSGRGDVRLAALRQIAGMDWELARTLGVRDRLVKFGDGRPSFPIEPHRRSRRADSPSRRRFPPRRSRQRTRSPFSTEGQSSICSGAVGESVPLV